MEGSPMLDYSIEEQKDHHHLGTRINIATRSAHTKLNKSLLLRLPLALPPRTTTPSVYVSGLIHVAPIYLAFESKWRDIVNWEPTTDEEEVEAEAASIENCLDEVSADKEGKGLEGDDASPKTSFRIHSTLKYLHIPVLERSARLKDDIRSITGWTEAEVDEQLRQVSENGELVKFISHIKRSVNQHPHVLLAYAWVLYMALFAGGRFIRGSLENAGAEFWDTACEAVLPSKKLCNKPRAVSSTSAQSISTSGYEGDDERSPVSRNITDPTETADTTSNHKPPSICSMGPLSFFRFPGPQDGEDIKVEFKKRLMDCESRLTTSELDDIVYEATHIFDYMNSLVSQLDALFEPSQPTADNDSGNGNSYIGSLGNSLESWARLLVPGAVDVRPRSRLRDSISIAKDRGVRPVSRQDDQSSIDSHSSVASSEWSDDRNWSKSPVCPGSGVVTGAGTDVSNLHTTGTLTPSAELKSVLHHPQQKVQGDIAGMGRSRSVRFGKAVTPHGKGLGRSKSNMERVVTYKDDDTSSETSAMARGGLDGAEELVYESEHENSHLEADEKPSHYGADGAGGCPVAGTPKVEKHVHFSITPSEEERLRRKEAASTSSKTMTVVKNGMVVLGLVGVLVGVGRFRV